MKKFFNGFIAFVAFAIVIILVLLVFSSCNNNEPAKQTPERVATKQDKFKQLTQITTTPVAFDHQGCQYPERWSNPADGCDNTDPAVPECIEHFATQQGEIDCIAKHQNQSSDSSLAQLEAENAQLKALVGTCAQGWYDSFDTVAAFDQSFKTMMSAWVLQSQELGDNATAAWNEAETMWSNNAREFDTCRPYVARTHPGNAG